MTILCNYPNEGTVGGKENKKQILHREAKEDFPEKMVFELKTGGRAF